MFFIIWYFCLLFYSLTMYVRYSNRKNNMSASHNPLLDRLLFEKEVGRATKNNPPTEIWSQLLRINVNPAL